MVLCRRLLSWFSYVLFLYNGFAGVVSAILRIVTTTAISMLLIFRMDIMILPHGFDTFDTGMLLEYRNIITYLLLSLLSVEHNEQH